MSDYAMGSVSGRTMLTYLPEYYETSRIMRSILDSEGREFDELNGALNEILDQFFVRSSSWALDTWEKELGLPTVPDQPDSERRDRLVSRLRGTGTATIGIVKEVAGSYDKGAVAVLENQPAYTVTIEFIDTFGIPPNIEDLKKAVRAVVPAHLDLVYQYRYILCADLAGYTYGQIQASGLTYGDLQTKLPM